ncbi:MAG: 8-oxoguanine deaminase [Armatimonadota bacterium]|nr:8-oxoguanine deaminase [Armatimonadota bacterium]MDR7454859.1 8-oxoguanine deaminase [Armatimonadota bacterium]MDR7457153.1 8-oxoguanine deaminase [Armatimonadota bacterium]MDR7495534.1 8-oxoguanine deaminase [Armatimonadota bacterium]
MKAVLLVSDCDVVVTMDEAGTEIPGGSILIDRGTVAWVGRGAPPALASRLESWERLDGRGLIALPGLVNTHHHLYQTLTRVRATGEGLFGWLRALYPAWAGMDEAWVHAGARVGLAELALSGCATAADHHYIFPRDDPAAALAFLAAEVEAAAEIGVRFHPARGAMDLGQSAGGLPPDDIVQDTDAILAQTEEAVRRFHDPSPGAMVRVAVAPCSPFSVSERLMRASAALARRLGVRLHTHIAETTDEQAYCLARYGRRPLEVLEAWGWLGPDVWLAHCVHVDSSGIGLLARGGAGVAWCPTSNLRLGSGVAPVPAMLAAGVPVGLGVDGSASNDAGHLLAEARMGLLVARTGGAAAMDARRVLRIATRGGAACLGRDDIGSLEPGKRADVALFASGGLERVGTDADPVAALVFCAPQRVRHLLVEGRPVVTDGRLVRADEQAIADEGRRVARRIATGVPAAAHGGQRARDAGGGTR